jgi:hypothetical protein
MQHTTGKSIRSRHTTQSAVYTQPEKVSAVDIQHNQQYTHNRKKYQK